jgi:predicted nuclease of predicted toxin-antitoxin system
MAAFLIDAQLPPALAGKLRALGHDAEHVSDIGLAVAGDSEIWRAAITRGAVLVSKDEDFVTISHLNREECRLLWIRLGNTTNRALWKALEPLVSEILQSFENGEWLIELL